MTPEGKVKKQVSTLLKQYAGCYSFMPVQNGMGSASIDYIGSYRGRAFGIETKKPGGKPTARQEETIRQMREAGAKVFVIDGDTSELKEWLDEYRDQ